MKRSILIAAVCVLCAFFALGCANDTKIESGDISVTLNTGGDELKITVMPKTELLEKYAKSDLILIMLEPGQSFSPNGTHTELARRRADDSVDFKIKLTENGKSRLYCAFTAAFFDSDLNVYVEAVESFAYVRNPEVLSVNSSKYPESDSIKGLNVKYDSESASLGISHAMIDIPFEDYLLPEGNGDAVSFIFYGRSYYIDRDAVEALDKRVRFYTENGVTVYFRFVLKHSYAELTGELSCLAYPGTSAGMSSYAVNMSDSKCALSVAALADFMAQRYTASDNAYGSVAAFVAGDNINSPGKSAGGTAQEEYVRSSAAFVRTLYTAMASHYEEGRVFVDVDNNLKGATATGVDSNVQSYLAFFAEYTAQTGDYPWGVSASVKATSADPDRVWYDNSGNGAYLTPSNLSSFAPDIMNVPELLYGDELRHMIIGDFSVSVGTGQNAEANQAASYAYTYYKALAAASFDALIYSTHADTESDRSGLYRTNLEGTPESERKIREIFCNIDTDADVNSFASGVINDAEWNALYSGYHESAVKKTLKSGMVSPCDPMAYSTSVLVDFSDGTLGGFECVGEGSYLGLVPNSASASLRATLVKTNAADKPYVVKKGIERSDLQSDNVLVTLSSHGTEGSVATAFNIRLELVQVNGKHADVIYKSALQTVAPNTIVTLAFNVKDAVRELRKEEIELRIYAEGNDGSSCVLTLDKLLAGKEKTNVFLIVLLCVLAAGALIAVVSLFFIWFRKNYEIQFDRTPKKTPEEKAKDREKKKAEKKIKKEKTPKKKKKDEKSKKEP